MARTINRSRAPSATGDRLPPLVVQIANQLEQQIISGRYPEGEWLREQEIADSFGTSRGPVREALRLVEQEGFVESVPWRGTRVIALSGGELDDLLEVVAALQGLVCRLVAVHGDRAEFEKIDNLVDAMEETLSSPEAMPQQLRLAFEAGVELRKICGSQRAGEMLMKVGRLAYWQHRYLLGADKRWRKTAVSKWRKLVSAIKNRDGEQADRAARDMVHHSKAYIMRTHGESLGDRLPEELPAKLGRGTDWQP